MTPNEESTSAAETAPVPHLIGHPMNGLSVVSVNGSRHAVLLVSDLGSAELAQLSQAVSLPLAQRLAARFTPDRDTMASLYVSPTLQDWHGWMPIDVSLDDRRPNRQAQPK
jgi:hypothetical protein